MRVTSALNVLLSSKLHISPNSYHKFNLRSRSLQLLLHTPSFKPKHIVRYLSQPGLPENNLMELLPRIHACPTCLGEGELIRRKKMSKKMRFERNLAKNFVPPLEKCPTCAGTGILVDNAAEQTNRLELSIPKDTHVAIIGGGIGGLALALACSHRNIPHTIYERDSSFNERAQGYGLTMQQGSKALQALGITSRNSTIGLHSKRHLVHTPNGQVVGEWGMKVWGRRKGQTDDSNTKAKRQNAHISRQELRRLLYEAWLASGCGSIRWGYKFIQYEENEIDDQSVSLLFHAREEGNDPMHKTMVEKATVVVGADGIRSAVRQQKVGEESTPLRYLGCIVILGIASSPSCSTLTSDNETVFQTADGTTRLYAMPFSEIGKETANAARLWHQENVLRNGSDLTVQEDCGETMWQLSFPMREEDAINLSKGGPGSLKQEAVQRCGNWHEPIPQLINQTAETLISGYPVYDRPLLTDNLLREGKSRSFQSKRVTLLGDAAHPMSPFKGQGANVALLDSISLARALVRAFMPKVGAASDEVRNSLENELLRYEKAMLERCEVKVKASAEAAKFLHTDIAILEGNCTRGGAAKATNTTT